MFNNVIQIVYGKETLGRGMDMKTWRVLLMLLVALITSGVPANLWAEQYYYYDLGTSSGFTSIYANSINDSGNVAGYALTDSNSARAFLWKPSTGMQNLGTVIPDYGYSMAYGQCR